MPAYYADSVGRFQRASLETLELTLTRAYESDRYRDLITTQISSWRAQIQTLKQALGDSCLAPFCPETWGLAIEFVVPRKMGRIDAVLLMGSTLVVLEFKTDNFDSSAADQVEDYCLDLINFRQPSHGRIAYPVVVANTRTGPQTRRTQIFGELQPSTFVDSNQLANWLSTIALTHACQLWGRPSLTLSFALTADDSHLSRCHSLYASLLPMPRSLATFFSAAFSSAFSSAMISRTRWAMLTVSDADGTAPSSAFAIRSVISPLTSPLALSCLRISPARPRRNSS